MGRPRREKAIEEKIVRIGLSIAPEDELHFRIIKNDVPAAGANVTLVTKGVIPLTFSKTADETGIVRYRKEELVPAIGEAIFDKIPWLFMANISNSEYAIWKDQAFFELGEAYDFKLKKYKEAPTFFVKIQLRDIIGAELFSNFITEIEKTALTVSGLEVIKVKGQGTRTVEIQFRPPWHNSALVIDWVAVWFCVRVLTVAAAIIAILVVSKWSFGEIGAGIAGGIGIGVLLLILLSAPKRGK